MQPVPAKGAIERVGDSAAGVGLIVFVFLTFRLFGLIMLQYGGLFGGSSDFDYYYAMGQQTEKGVWPYLHYWSEYPPVFPWLIVGVYRFAELVAGAPPSSGFFESLLRATLLPFDLGNLLLIHALARRMYSREVALRAAWIYAGLFAPALIWLGWFEPLPIFWMLISLWLLVNRRYSWAGAATGVGIVTKIIPGLIALVALRTIVDGRLNRDRLVAFLSYAVPCAALALLICLPFVVANPSLFFASGRAWFSRLPWETLWAVANGYYLFGLVPSLGTRVGWPTYATPSLSDPTIGMISLLALVAVLAVLSWLGWGAGKSDPDQLSSLVRRQVGLAGALYAGLLLISTGFSPQFMAWLVPYIILVTPGLGAVIWVSALTLIVLLGERFLYYRFTAPSEVVLLVLVGARSVLLAGLLWEFIRLTGVTSLRSWPNRRSIGGAITVVTLVAATAVGLQTLWSADRPARRDEPTQVESEVLHQVTDPLDAILTFEVSEYRRLAPSLGDRPFYLLGPDRLADTRQTETTMRALAAHFTSVILLERGEPSLPESVARDWLNHYGIPIDETTAKTGLTVVRYVLPDRLAWPSPSPQTDQFAQFGHDLELLGYSRAMISNDDGTGRLRLTLYWRPLRPIDRPLDLQMRLTDPTGESRLVTGEIGQRYPVTAWNPGQVVVDEEEITLRQPSGLSALSLAWLDPASHQALPLGGQTPGATQLDLGAMP